MLTLGIDPGSRHTGYGLVRTEGSTLTAVTYGRISCAASQPMPARLAHLGAELGRLLDEWHPAVAALESTFHGMNAKSLIVLSQARGALLATLGGAGIHVEEYTPAEVKVAVTGQGRADKAQVAHMVRLILSLGRARIPADATDALAVAICCSHRRKLDRLTTPERQ